MPSSLSSPHRVTPGPSPLPPAAGLALAAITLSPTVAEAFSISSAVSRACHEPITMEALRSVRLTRPEAAPLISTDRTDAAVIDDLPFKVDADMTDLGAVSLLIGIRD